MFVLNRKKCVLRRNIYYKNWTKPFSFDYISFRILINHSICGQVLILHKVQYIISAVNFFRNILEINCVYKIKTFSCLMDQILQTTKYIAKNKNPKKKFPKSPILKGSLTNIISRMEEATFIMTNLGTKKKFMKKALHLYCTVSSTTTQLHCSCERKSNPYLKDHHWQLIFLFYW